MVLVAMSSVINDMGQCPASLQVSDLFFLL